MKFNFEDKETLYSLKLNLDDTSELVNIQKDLFVYGLIGFYQKRVPLINVTNIEESDQIHLKNAENYAMEINKISLGMRMTSKIKQFSPLKHKEFLENDQVFRVSKKEDFVNQFFSPNNEKFFLLRHQNFLEDLENFLIKKEYKFAYYAILENHDKMEYVIQKQNKTLADEEIIIKYRDLIKKNIQDGIFISAHNNTLPLKYNFSVNSDSYKILTQVLNLCLVHINCFDSKIPAFLVLLDFYKINDLYLLYQEIYDYLNRYPDKILEKQLENKIIIEIRNTDIFKEQKEKIKIFDQAEIRENYVKLLSENLFNLYSFSEATYKTILSDVFSNIHKD